MQAIRWLYDQAVAGDPSAWRDGGDAHCYLCAQSCPDASPSQPTKTAMRDTFTNHDLAQCRESAWVCPACAWYLDNGQQFRTFSWQISPSVAAMWDRATMRADLDLLLQESAPYIEPLILAISVSHKKHVVLRATPAYSSNPITVQFEEQSVTITPDVWQAVAAPFDALRALGHGKTEILTGHLHPMGLKRHGQIGRALALMVQLAPWRDGQLLELLAYVSPGGDQSAKDTENDRYGDLRDGGSVGTLSVGWDTNGVQKQVPPRHLGTGATSRRGPRQNDGNPGDVAQSRLFDL